MKQISGYVCDASHRRVMRPECISRVSSVELSLTAVHKHSYRSHRRIDGDAIVYSRRLTAVNQKRIQAPRAVSSTKMERLEKARIESVRTTNTSKEFQDKNECENDEVQQDRESEYIRTKTNMKTKTDSSVTNSSSILSSSTESSRPARKNEGKSAVEEDGKDRRTIIKRKEEIIIISTISDDVDVHEMNRFLNKTCSIEPRDPQKFKLALQHSSAVVVAFALPIKTQQRRMYNFPKPRNLHSLKATARLIVRKDDDDSTQHNNENNGINGIIDGSLQQALLEEKRVIGFARAYSDGAFSAMISDVAIEPAYERNEIGRKMILTLIERLRAQGIGSFAAMVSRGTHDYFHTCGFRETYLRALSFKGIDLSSINVERAVAESVVQLDGENNMLAQNQNQDEIESSKTTRVKERERMPLTVSVASGTTV